MNILRFILRWFARAQRRIGEDKIMYRDVEWDGVHFTIFPDMELLRWFPSYTKGVLDRLEDEAWTEYDRMQRAQYYVDNLRHQMGINEKCVDCILHTRMKMEQMTKPVYCMAR